MVLAPSSDRERSLVRWEGVLQRGQGGDYRCLPQPCKAQERSCVFSCVPEHSCDQSVFFLFWQKWRKSVKAMFWHNMWAFLVT